MKKWNYYNDNDPFAAQWARNLIKAGLVPDGEVDERSILDVSPDDLRGFHQCHFFSGILGWPYALQLAGWEGECWTGSCPCQPFSVAGAGKGTADERHLWPAFRRLIEECGPPVVFGEQVASEAGRTWLTGVRADLEELGYACGAADLCASGVTAPHIRQRLYWVADAQGAERERGRGAWRGRAGFTDNSAAHGLADHDHDGPYRTRGVATVTDSDGQDGRLHRGSVGGVGYADNQRPQGREFGGQCAGKRTPWADGLVIECGDGKCRRIPIEPSLQYLADGIPGTMGGGWNAFCKRIQKELTDATDDQGVASKVLRTLWNSDGENTVQRTPGGSESLLGEALLFAALRELSGPMGGIPQDAAQGVPEGTDREVFGLRENPAQLATTSRTSHRRELAGQFLGELGNRLLRMSHEEASCDEARTAYEILTAFPLASGPTPGRVGILRGAGNAIVPPLAAEFVQAFMEIDAR